MAKCKDLTKRGFGVTSFSTVGGRNGKRRRKQRIMDWQFYYGIADRVFAARRHKALPHGQSFRTGTNPRDAGATQDPRRQQPVVAETVDNRWFLAGHGFFTPFLSRKGVDFSAVTAKAGIKISRTEKEGRAFTQCYERRGMFLAKAGGACTQFENGETSGWSDATR
jgi:hypothetical protein